MKEKERVVYEKKKEMEEVVNEEKREGGRGGLVK